MGQKIHPYGLRLGINKSWRSKWYVDPREYAETLHQDLKLREVLKNSPEARGADVAEVEIIRHPQRITLVIHTSRPGVIIGTKGSNIEKIGARLQKVAGKKIQIKIKEIKRPETNAQVVALNVARQLRSRSSFRRTLKMAVNNAMKAGRAGRQDPHRRPFGRCRDVQEVSSKRPAGSRCTPSVPTSITALPSP